MTEFKDKVTYYYNEPIPGREDKNLPAIFMPKRRDAKNRTATETQETINTANQLTKEGGERNERLGNRGDNYWLRHKNP